MIEEILVTARKREESLQDAPVVMTALSEEMLRTYNVDSLEDIASFVPGLIVANSHMISGVSIAMRGVTTGTSSPAFDQSISMVSDGIQVSSAHIGRVSQIDMEQVEVLKGPQALFYGKNSPGGVISYRTANPGDEFEASVRVGYELEAEQKYVEAMVSGPITDTLGARLVAYYSDMDGWVDNEVTPIPGFVQGAHEDKLPYDEEVFVRGTLLWEPSDRLSVLAKLNYNDKEGPSHVSGGQQIGCFFGAPQNFPLDDCEADDLTNFGDLLPEVAAVDPIAQGDGRDRGEDSWTMGSLEINYDLIENIQLTSITGLLDAESEEVSNYITGSPGFFGGSNRYEQEHFSQEFRLTSDFDGNLNFMAGLFYGETKLDYQVNVIIGVAPGFAISLSPPAVQSQDHESLSAFGQLILDISDTLELSAGLRYSDEEREQSIVEAGVEVTNLVPKNDFDNTSPEVTPDLAPQRQQYIFCFLQRRLQIRWLQHGVQSRRLFGVCPIGGGFRS